MKRRRLHWFWRSSLATAGAGVLSWISNCWWRGWDWPFARVSDFFELHVPYPYGDALGCMTAYELPPVILALVIFGLLSWWFGPPRGFDGETRCRKCGYILRGITEPRCSECGEQI
jgi:hypothetical protein